MAKKVVNRRSVVCQCMILRSQKAGAHRPRSNKPKHKTDIRRDQSAW